MKKSPKLRCSRCMKAIKASKWGYYDNVLTFKIEGGYAEFIDDIMYSTEEKNKYPLTHHLCHQCAHDLVNWLNIPAAVVKNWHPKEKGDSFCDGWTIER